MPEPGQMPYSDHPGQRPSPWDGPLPDPPPRPDGPLPDPPIQQPGLQWGLPVGAPTPPPRAPGRPTVSRLAVVTLVLGVLGGIGLTVILGVIALLRIRTTHKRGAALAVIGMILPFITVIGGFVIYNKVLPGVAVRDASGKIVQPGDVAVTTLRIGDCIEHWATSNTVGTVKGVPCTASHDAEVFHTFTMAGTAYPGDAQVTAQATTQCQGKVKTAVKAADAKTARVALITPVASSWKRGDKQVACVAVASAPLTRSVRN
jgi:hypothetical protein